MGNMGLRKISTKKNPKCPKCGGNTLVKARGYDPKSKAFTLRECKDKKCNFIETQK